MVNEAFQIISEDCNTWEEEVSCEHEMSSRTKENEQHRQHEDVSTDGTHLPNQSLQTMNGNTSTHEEEGPCEHEVSNITQNKRNIVNDNIQPVTRKGLNKVVMPMNQRKHQFQK